MIDREDITRMAREADATGYGDELTGDAIERFAALIAASAVEREREACAKVCEDLVFREGETDKWTITREKASFDCAAAIRARGST